MFEFIVINEKKGKTHTTIEVLYSDGDEEYTDIYTVWNKNKSMELETLKNTQFIYVSEMLSNLKTKYGTIYEDISNKILKNL